MIGLKSALFVHQFRKGCLKNDTLRDKGLIFPNDIVAFRNEQYGPDSKSNILDLYIPTNISGKLPVLVSVHGGGYIYGNKEIYQFYTAEFAKKGFAVVNFTYTLAPKRIFPTQLYEINWVMEWITENAGRFMLDTENVVMIGDSAGAQLTSQYAAIQSNPEYAEIMGIKPADIKLKAVSLGCGMYDMKNSGRNSSVIEDIYLTKNPEVFGEMLDVLNYIDERYPATYLLSSPGDFLVGNVEPMEKLLKERGVICSSKIYGDSSVQHVFFCDIKTELAKEANEDQASFLKAHID